MVWEAVHARQDLEAAQADAVSGALADYRAQAAQALAAARGGG